MRFVIARLQLSVFYVQGLATEYLLLVQIHNYMLNKAPPVPQLIPAQAAEKNSTNEDGESQVSSQNAGVHAAGEELPNTEVDERIVEERHEALLNANPVTEGMGVARLVTAGHSSEQQQQLQRPETRVQRPVDDRLFTWAAVGLTIAIAFLLLKKFLKASEYGAVFMDGS